MPLALITGSALGADKNLINACALALSLAWAPMPAARE